MGFAARHARAQAQAALRIMTRRRGISPATVRRLALQLPEAVEGSHFDHPDFRVRNKIFATLPPDGLTAGLKATPVNIDALVSADADTYRDLWGGRWLGVRLDHVTLSVLRELLRDAWCLAAPKRLAALARDSTAPPSSPSARAPGD